MSSQIPFNLEWAKRGGVFLAQDNAIHSHIQFFGMSCGLVIKRFVNATAYVVGDWSVFIKSYSPIRMTTRKECDAAGIEYIEPPVNVVKNHELERMRINRIKELEAAITGFESPMQPVKLLRDDGSHWYVIPAERRNDFFKDRNKESMDFEDKWSKYKTNGDSNNIQLYAAVGYESE